MVSVKSSTPGLCFYGSFPFLEHWKAVGQGCPLGFPSTFLFFMKVLSPFLPFLFLYPFLDWVSTPVCEFLLVWELILGQQAPNLSLLASSSDSILSWKLHLVMSRPYHSVLLLHNLTSQSLQGAALGSHFCCPSP